MLIFSEQVKCLYITVACKSEAKLLYFCYRLVMFDFTSSIMTIYLVRPVTLIKGSFCSVSYFHVIVIYNVFSGSSDTGCQ